MRRATYFDLTGKSIGLLNVIERTSEKLEGTVKWKCVCACGKQTFVRSANLINGSTKSCGCLRRKLVSEQKSTHKKTGDRIYVSWVAMKNRCNNPKAGNYNSYGGRGIKICRRWEKFENFLEDMGERPEGKSLDRIDVDGNYEPSNCRWATRKEQSDNRRSMKHINEDTLLNFLKTQDYLTEEVAKKIATNFFKNKFGA